jgi:hypothetical protein
VAGKRWSAECKRLSFVLILYVAKRGNKIVFRDSAVILFAVICGKLGEQNALSCSFVYAISLINELVCFSQAGRRGFDPRLPLHISPLKYIALQLYVQNDNGNILNRQNWLLFKPAPTWLERITRQAGRGWFSLFSAQQNGLTKAF